MLMLPKTGLANGFRQVFLDLWSRVLGGDRQKGRNPTKKQVGRWQRRDKTGTCLTETAEQPSFGLNLETAPPPTRGKRTFTEVPWGGPGQEDDGRGVAVEAASQSGTETRKDRRMDHLRSQQQAHISPLPHLQLP